MSLIQEVALAKQKFLTFLSVYLMHNSCLKVEAIFGKNDEAILNFEKVYCY